MVKRQSQTSPVLSNFNLPLPPPAASRAGRDSWRVLAILNAVCSRASNDFYAIPDTSDSVAAGPLPPFSADALLTSGEPSLQAAANTDTGNVSSGAPLALSPHTSDESGLSVTDTGVRVGGQPDSFSNLGGAAQAGADGALPPNSDIQTLNELSSDSTDEVQIVHDVARGASWAFYTAGSGEQNFTNAIVVTIAATAQGAASDALGTPPASITGFSVSIDPRLRPLP